MSTQPDQAPGSLARSPLRFLLRVPVPWVFVLTYLLALILESIHPWRVASRALGCIGWVLLLFGVLIAGWGLIIFRTSRTTTVPGEISSTLVIRGPYRVTRNPMYLGLILAYLGELAIMKQVWPLVCLPLVLAYLNWVVIPLEEARLFHTFGNSYAEYQSKVRRWI